MEEMDVFDQSQVEVIPTKLLTVDICVEIKKSLKNKAIEAMLNKHQSDDYQYGFYDGGVYVLSVIDEMIKEMEK